MYYSYFDIDSVTPASQSRGLKKLSKYREEVKAVIEHSDSNRPEYSLAHVKNPDLHDTIDELKKKFKKIKKKIKVK